MTTTDVPTPALRETFSVLEGDVVDDCVQRFTTAFAVIVVVDRF